MAGNGQVIAFPPIQIFDCLSAVVSIVEDDGSILNANAIYVKGLNRFFEIGNRIKAAIYGEVVGGFELELIPHTTSEQYRRTSFRVAIKIYHKDLLINPRVSAENPQNEISAMEYLRSHPNLMQLICCCQDAANLYSIMPFLQSIELFDFIDHYGKMTDEQAKLFFRQLTIAIKHMHSLGAAHRDLSLENVLVLPHTDDIYQHQFVVIDFGMCIRLLELPENSGIFPAVRFPGCCGKRNYIAPELHRRDPFLNPLLADIWSMGVILFMVLTGVPPVDSAVPTDQRYRVIVQGRLAALLQAWHINLHPSVIDLLSKMFKSNPLDRITMDEIIQHPWLN
jgi:serine/threonine protein kinase